MKQIKISVWANIRNLPQPSRSLDPLDVSYTMVYPVGDDLDGDNFNPHKWMQRFEADLAKDRPDLLWDEGEILLPAE